MAPLKAQNYITLMEGTENQKSFYLQNPSQPTEDDILKIKKTLTQLKKNSNTSEISFLC